MKNTLDDKLIFKNIKMIILFIILFTIINVVFNFITNLMSGLTESWGSVCSDYVYREIFVITYTGINVFLTVLITLKILDRKKQFHSQILLNIVAFLSLIFSNIICFLDKLNDVIEYYSTVYCVMDPIILPSFIGVTLIFIVIDIVWFIFRMKKIKTSKKKS